MVWEHKLMQNAEKTAYAFLRVLEFSLLGQGVRVVYTHFFK
jgi:hypothetical protein